MLGWPCCLPTLSPLSGFSVLFAGFHYSRVHVYLVFAVGAGTQLTTAQQQAQIGNDVDCCFSGNWVDATPVAPPLAPMRTRSFVIPLLCLHQTHTSRLQVSWLFDNNNGNSSRAELHLTNEVVLRNHFIGSVLFSCGSSPLHQFVILHYWENSTSPFVKIVILMEAHQTRVAPLMTSL